MYERRVARVVEQMEQQGFDALLVSGYENCFYLTGWDGNHWLFIDEAGATFVVQSGDVAEVRTEIPGAIIASEHGSRDFSVQAARLIRERGCQRVSYDGNCLTAAAFTSLTAALNGSVELANFDELVRQVRAIKEPEEINRLREASKITDDLYVALLDWLKPGVSEREIARFIARQAVQTDADGMSFMLVGSGPLSAWNHNQPTDRVVQDGEFCWVDFSVLVDGYTGDLSRVFAFGEPGEKARRLHAALLKSLDAGIAACVVGAHADAVGRAYRAELEPLGFNARHVAGHGVGLEIHELPKVDSESHEVVIEQNTVFTADPGVYEPGWGGMRVEDVILATEAGPELLNHAPRELVII